VDAALQCPLSWHCLLGGYGNYPATLERSESSLVNMKAVEEFVAGCAINFPAHRDALAILHR